MMRLVRVELTRLRKRRAVLVLLLVSLIAPLLIVGGTVWDTRPVSAAETQEARALVAEELASEDFQSMIDQCVAHPGQWGVRAKGDNAKRQCLKQNKPRVDWYLQRSPLRLGEQFSTGLLVLSLATALMMLAATTFIGHDWNSGSMSNQLLFEPRRSRVFWAKSLAVVLMALLASALALSIFWGGLGIAAQVREIQVPDGFVRSVLERSGRGVLFVAAAALGAFAITNLFRSTVVTLGLLFAIVVAASVVVSLLPFPDNERLQISVNLAAWINGDARYYRDISSACWDALDRGQAAPADLDCRQQGLITLWGSVQYFGALLLTAVGLSFWTFHRRDVP